MDNNTMERELGWDDQIEKDQGDFVVLPEGNYGFQVIGFERARHPGSEKLPPCNKAVVSIKLSTMDGSQSTTVKHNLFLHSKCEGMLCAFFVGIGQKKKGEPLKMNWNNIIGRNGLCHVKVRKWTSNNGNEMESNEISKFYEYGGEDFQKVMHSICSKPQEQQSVPVQPPQMQEQQMTLPFQPNQQQINNNWQTGRF